MRLSKKNIGIRIFFLALFLSYFADITFFTHTHIINGVTIVHSHYFHGSSAKQKEGAAGHQHSVQALTWIAQANDWNVILYSVPEVPDNILHSYFFYFPHSPFIVSLAVLRSAYLRGPPVLIG